VDEVGINGYEFGGGKKRGKALRKKELKLLGKRFIHLSTINFIAIWF
jgi:hypothetical protein